MRKAILERYLIKEIVYTFIGVTAVLFLIFMSGQLASLYSKAASGGLQAKSVMIALGLKSIANLVLVLPLSFYLSILVTLSRLYQDNEMVVLFSCGISPWRIVRAVLMVTVFFAVLLGVLVFQLAPWAEARNELLTSQSKNTNNLEGIAAGQFKEVTKGEGVVYIQEFADDEKYMKNMFMQINTPQRQSTIKSNRGYRFNDEKTGDRFLIFEDGYRYERDLQSKEIAVSRFKTHGVRLEEEREKHINLRQKSVSTAMLWKRAQIQDIAELQWRVSIVLLSIILAIMVVPLSRTSPRQGRYTKLAIALSIFIIYLNMLGLSRAWINQQQIATWIGMWWVHLAALLIALSMFVRWRVLWQRLTTRAA